jgi:hypothetical protein
LRIIERAGLKPWPRLFHNMRASRQTELTARFPLHVVCEWIGNSAPIADKHYLQVTDSHYADAAAAFTTDQGGAQRGAESSAAGTRRDSRRVARERREGTKSPRKRGSNAS